jgi:hypothetical protein
MISKRFSALHSLDRIGTDISCIRMFIVSASNELVDCSRMYTPVFVEKADLYMQLPDDYIGIVFGN